ncbi:MAG: DNA polymerase V subunit UmuC [Leptospiraceae bacterium]|nr:MAG: DNA polymerase V subunit UmuC [Leptospiraceae bacterium]
MLSIQQEKNNKIFALVDANNFYASCEIIFNPKLKEKPVIVLSNNDGCVISRSPEAKQLGIKMGQPFFEIQDIVKKHRVYVFSSNFPLYADMSYRFHESLNLFFPEIEVYSVDESFIDLSSLKKYNLTSYCLYVRNEILRWLKIPSCIGIGRTKTLAKLANKYAKQHPELQGVFNSINRETILLKNMPIEEVWGIGSKLSQFLYKKGIHTPYDLIQQNDYWIKKHLKINGLRMVYELRGISCYNLESYNPQKKNTVVSRSFGTSISNLEDLEKILMSFIEKLSEKLIKQKQLATYLGIFIKSNPFNKKEPYYSNYKIKKLETPTNSIRILYQNAKKILKNIYKPEIKYKKMGVIALNLCSIDSFQKDLFDNQNYDKEQLRNEAILKLMHYYNHSGKIKIQFAKNIQLPKNTWFPKQYHLSKRYTTDINEIPIAKI